MKDTKILQHSLKEYKLTLILTLYITSGICRRWAKQQKVNSNFTFQIKNNQLKIKTNILSCKFSKCDPVSELLSIFCLLSGLPAGDDLLELAPDGAAHDHQAVSLAVPHALHSCLEAQTQFFELFNNRDVEKTKKKSSLKSWGSMPRTVRLLRLPLPRSLVCLLRTPGLSHYRKSECSTFENQAVLQAF